MTLPTFRGARRPGQWRNYGTRTVKPSIVGVVHMTGNRSTASMPVGIDAGDGTYAEWRYAGFHVGSKDGPSAHRYVARDGSYIDMIDAKYWAWSNGDLVRPDTRYAGVAAMVAAARRGINANQLAYREYELTGYPGSFEVTLAQLQSTALQLAKDSIALKLPLIAGKTVLLHAWINTVNRQNCPFGRATRTKRMAELMALASAYRAELLNPTTPKPDPEEEVVIATRIKDYPPGTKFVIAAGNSLKAYRFDPVTGDFEYVRTFAAPADRPTGAKADMRYEITNSAKTFFGSFEHVVDGALKGLIVEAQEVTIVLPDSPDPDPVDVEAIVKQRVTEALKHRAGMVAPELDQARAALYEGLEEVPA